MDTPLARTTHFNADRKAPATGSASETPDVLIARLGQAARAAARVLAVAPSAQKNAALLAMADAVEAQAPAILAANAEDMAAASAKGLSAALLDRLKLDTGRIAAMARGLREVAALADPVGTVIAAWERPNGLKFERVRVPLGVIGIIYESRPNVTADAGALCLKSSNAVILRGGSESFRSSAALVAALHRGLSAAGLPEAAIQSVPTTDRAAVGALLRATEHVDVIVPRGGRSLVERVYAEAKVPVLAHLDGNCHTYLHASADPAMALSVVMNAKLRRTGVCGATETLLVDAAAAERLLPPILAALAGKGCAIRGCERTRALFPDAKPASEADWRTEYLDAILAVRVVDGIDAAITHVNGFGSHHTDAIIAEDGAAAERFLAEVDSGIVLHNASTQFADGGEFGFGAEIGIATGKLHARGPVGVEQLTTMKYRVHGTGQTRP